MIKAPLHGEIKIKFIISAFLLFLFLNYFRFRRRGYNGSSHIQGNSQNWTIIRYCCCARHTQNDWHEAPLRLRGRPTVKNLGAAQASEVAAGSILIFRNLNIQLWHPQMFNSHTASILLLIQIQAWMPLIKDLYWSWTMCFKCFDYGDTFRRFAPGMRITDHIYVQ